MKNTKYFLLIFVCIIMLSFSVASQVGERYYDFGELGQSMARKMRDSIKLTEIEYRIIERINDSINLEMESVWRGYSNRDSIKYHVQRIEDSRDIRYRRVLRGNKYVIYIGAKVYFLRPE